MKPVIQTSQFKKDIKRLKKRGKDLNKLGELIRVLASDGALEEKHRDHALIGQWVDCMTTTPASADSSSHNADIADRAAPSFTVV